MGRNNADFSAGKEPELKEVSTAHVDGKITHEEASDLSEGWNDRSVAAFGMDKVILRKDKVERPRILPTSDNRRKAIHKKAGLNEE